jgi:hypothetical protein
LLSIEVIANDFQFYELPERGSPELLNVDHIIGRWEKEFVAFNLKRYWFHQKWLLCSSVVERQSCKLKVQSAILCGGTMITSPITICVLEINSLTF